MQSAPRHHHDKDSDSEDNEIGKRGGSRSLRMVSARPVSQSDSFLAAALVICVVILVQLVRVVVVLSLGVVVAAIVYHSLRLPGREHGAFQRSSNIKKSGQNVPLIALRTMARVDSCASCSFPT